MHTYTINGLVRVFHLSNTIPQSQKLLLAEHEFQKAELLWIGKNHLLSRGQVQELVERMQYWIENGELKQDN